MLNSANFDAEAAPAWEVKWTWCNTLWCCCWNWLGKQSGSKQYVKSSKASTVKADEAGVEEKSAKWQLAASAAIDRRRNKQMK